MDSKKQFSDLSYVLTKKLDKEEKKKYGIYFTPKDTIILTLQLLKPYIKNIKTILEPSCGSGEYIKLLNKQIKNCNITGIEYNKIIYDSIQESIKGDNINLINQDYLQYETDVTFDLIIGNPPYFVMKKNDTDNKYYQYFEGRPNIFIPFIIKSLKLLKKDGILSFVLPKSFINCLYYDKTRNYINKNYKILHIVDCNDSYIDTKQETIIIIIQNKQGDNKEFLLEINNFTILGSKENILDIKKLYINSTSLFQEDFVVNVGNIVWNQCKDILSDDNNKTRLIYSSDISKNELILNNYKNKEKKNFINKKGNSTPILVINRGYGVGKYNFEYCLIRNINYLIENHLICIKYTKSITDEKLIEKYYKIIDSLNNEKTKKFIKIYFGNSAINTTELKYILPFYDI